MKDTKMLKMIVSNLLFSEGRVILAVIIGVALLGLLLHKSLLFLALGAFLFSFYFFRNPERSCPAAELDSAVLVCPADGRVVDISSGKISIFLSPLDVHVNRVPCAGTIEKLAYKPGKFMMAFVPKSSELNERNDVTIVTKEGNRIIVRQIAGTIARKICWWVKENDYLEAGKTFGMIRFGSRVDLLFEPGAIDVALKKGEYVYGGQTVLGRWTQGFI